MALKHENMFVADKPVEKIEEDLLARAPFAENISRNIISWDAKNESRKFFLLP